MCESGGTASDVDGSHAINARSKGGWTPLSRQSKAYVVHVVLTVFFSVNAASKGHLPVVLYLLTKQSADPLVRNNWGETAYDAAAAVFEVWICQVSYTLNTCHVCHDLCARFFKKPKLNDGLKVRYPIIL